MATGLVFPAAPTVVAHSTQLLPVSLLLPDLALLPGHPAHLPCIHCQGCQTEWVDEWVESLWRSAWDSYG